MVEICDAFADNTDPVYHVGINHFCLFIKRKKTNDYLNCRIIGLKEYLINPIIKLI